MKSQLRLIVSLLLFGLLSSCSTESNPIINQSLITKNLNYLALGDSYTIGQSVCETCRFPIQLQDSIKKHSPKNTSILTKIIATTDWTTTDLKQQLPMRIYPINMI